MLSFRGSDDASMCFQGIVTTIYYESKFLQSPIHDPTFVGNFHDRRFHKVEIDKQYGRKYESAL
jgi:hypothetical protein